MRATRRSVLIVASRFPDPIYAGGSVRIEKLVRHLPESGWSPIVLTTRVPESLLALPEHRGANVFRTPSHLGWFRAAYERRHGARRRGAAAVEVARRVKNRLLLPDDFVLWAPIAVPAGLRLARSRGVDAVLATGPPFSQLSIGAWIAALAGRPYVADFRDDWVGNPALEPRGAWNQRADRRAQSAVARRAARLVCASAGIGAALRTADPDAEAKIEVVENGYDAGDGIVDLPAAKAAGRLRLLHAGSAKAERPLGPLFEAMARAGAGVELVCRGMTHGVHRDAAARLGVGERVRFLEAVPSSRLVDDYRHSDAVVLLPSGNTPRCIPAKTYEYVASGRPILVISEPNETTAFLDGMPGVVVHATGDVAGIAETLRQWRKAESLPRSDPGRVARYERRAIAGRFAALLDRIASS